MHLSCGNGLSPLQTIEYVMLRPDISHLMRSPSARKVLLALEADPLMPLQIAQKSGIHRSHVSNKLSSHQERGLVECLNPEDKKRRFYRLASHGKELLQDIKKTES